VVAAAGLLLPVQLLLAAILHSALVGLLGAALTMIAVLLVCMVATAPSHEVLERLDWWLLGIGIVILILAISASIIGATRYFTDETALIHGAAVTLLHGHDPYGANLTWALARYGITGNQNLTYLMNGGAADTLNYPALPMLLSLPNVAIDQQSAAVAFVAGAAVCVATGAMFLVLPEPLRPLAVIICIDFPILIQFGSLGLNTVMMLPALTFCVYRWASVGTAGADPRGSLGRTGVIRALCLGLAIATNQLAWFIAPFLLAGTFLSARQRLGGRPALRITASYGLLALLVFLAINVPFIAWGPGQWLTGVLAPVLQHAVPSGQGLVGLTIFARIGSGALSFYAYGSAFLYVALLCIFWLRFERVYRCMAIFPLLAIYTGARSLDSYWLGPLSILVVSIACSGMDPTLSAPQNERVGPIGVRSLAPNPLAPLRLALRRVPEPLRWAAALAPAIACFAIALGTPGPLELKIAGTRSDAQGDLDRLIVMARNSSGATLTPNFAINGTDSLSTFWRVVSGPARLHPGQVSKYVLDAPTAKAEPTAGTKYILQAFTDAPETISSSARVTAPGR
jgi:uncharacterized membrane protein